MRKIDTIIDTLLLADYFCINISFFKPDFCNFTTALDTSVAFSAEFRKQIKLLSIIVQLDVLEYVQRFRNRRSVLDSWLGNAIN